MDIAARISTLSPEQRRLLERKLEQQDIDILKLPVTREAVITDQKQGIPLSFGQERLWFIHQLEPHNSAYNLVRATKLEGNLNIRAVDRSVNEIIRRHGILRTVFIFDSGKPVQVVCPELSFPIETIDIEDFTREEREREVRRVIREESLYCFDLEKGPLLRMKLLKLSDREHVFLLVIHHIISDGTSIQVFIRELARLYEAFLQGKASPLAELPIQYVDYACWQRKWFGEESLNVSFRRKQEAYWLEQFQGEIPLLTLPTDYPRPVLQSFEGDTIDFHLDTYETTTLKKMAFRMKTTLYVVLLSIFNIFLSRLGGREDIVVGTPVAGRRHPDVQHLIGMFVNTLALRNYPHRDKTFAAFLEEVKKSTLNAFENQEYRYEDIVNKINAGRDTGRNPLFDVTFLLKNVDYAEVHIPGLTLKNYRYESKTSKFDLNLSAWEEEGEAGDMLHFSFEYCTKLFKQQTIGRFSGYFKEVVRSVITHPGKEISGIEIIPEEEKKKILYDFNDTRTRYPRDKTIVELFEEQVERIPDSIASVFEDKELSYRELNEKANRSARHLQSRGAAPDTIVGIMMEGSIEMIIGIVGILKAGGAYLPVSPGYPAERKKYMLKDSDSQVLLTEKKYKGQIDYVTEVIEIDNEEIYRGGAGNPGLYNGAHGSAYVIYTSGSTGKPKGVVAAHRNVLRLVKNTGYIEFRSGENDRVLQTGALEFDASTFEIWGTLLNGWTLYLAAKNDILTPEKLQEMIRKYDIRTMWLTSPLFNRLSLVDSGIFAGLRNLLIGGDVLSPFHINRVRGRFPRLNIINGYGPTENTTFSTTFPIREEYEERMRIPIGKPIANTTAYIVDKHHDLLPIGVPGELCLGGDGLAGGYLNNPELTAERFIFSSKRIYKTGDLARWLEDGNIDFLGRIDRQVKIRGYRIEPGEIESRLLKHEKIKEVVVLSGESETGERYLCAYIASAAPGAFTDESPVSSELRKYLSRFFPDYMIPSYFMPIENVPLTSNGKVDEKALPCPEPGTAGEYAAPRNEIEEKLVEIWGEILGLTGLTGIDDNFFDLGGHSLKATVLVARIHKRLKVKIPLEEVFKRQTIRGLSGYIEDAGEEMYAGIEPVEEKEYYALSPAQKRLYILQQMESAGTAYNMPQVIDLPGAADIEKLENIFKKLVHRHESLRTSFAMVNGEPVQRIYPRAAFKIEYCDFTADSTITGHFVRPFDLSRAPLFRVGLVEMAGKKSLLLVDMHHIITDGVSQTILRKEFAVLYGEENLPALRFRYKDYACWKQREEEKAWMKKQEAHWLNEFSKEIPISNLPFDYLRPAVRSFEGHTFGFALEKKEVTRLHEFASKENATLYMVLLGIFYVFLSKLCGQEDIVVGTPLAGRRHEELELIMGMFVNTLAMRNYPSAEKPFREFLIEVKERTLKAFENQEYPFEDLVDKVFIGRDAGRNPLFDVMLVLQDMENPIKDIPGFPGLKLKTYEYENNISKFDMTLTAIETESGLLFTWEYCTKLFKQETIERFSGYFKKAVSFVLEDPGRKISRIEIIPEEERKRILYDFNDTGTQYPGDKRIDEIFAEQAERIPDNIASVFADKELSYKELNEKSNRLARLLRQRGVQADTIVGIMIERSIDMMIGILGILKAGGAYLPIDPGYPRERIDYMLRDSGAKILLTNLPEGRNIHHSSLITQHSGNLAYVIYTSGSTGNPRGVMITHRSLVNRLSWMQRAYPLEEQDVILQKTTIVFDVSVWELFWWSIAGASVCLLGPGGEKNPEVMIQAIKRYRVTTMHFVPSMLHVFLEYLEGVGDIDMLSSLRQVFSSGEALMPRHVEGFNKILKEKNGIVLINLYGPTEAAIDVSYYNCRDWEIGHRDRIPIGKPIDNIKLYVVDKGLHLQGIGIAGELCIAGDGLARGYLNRPGLTAEKFLDHRTYRTYRSYKTGDLARWLPDGNIDFLGRIDHQVKIRGFRIEPGEIENRLLKHEKIKEAVVLTGESESGDNYLCAYIVSGTPGAFTDESAVSSELKEYLSQFFPDYMIPSYFTQIEKLPLTPNGKVDRKALPSPEIKATAEYTAPRDLIEETLVGIWSEVLNISPGSIGIDDNFFTLGGHSLRAIRMVSLIKKTFNVEFQLSSVFRGAAVRALGQYISKAKKSIYEEIPAVEKKDYYPQSSAQKRLFFLDKFENIGVSYNMSALYKIEGKIDKKRFEDTFTAAITRHESLRTSFHQVNDEPVQQVHPAHDVIFEIKYYDCRGGPLCPPLDFVRPFDMAKAPLLRVGMVTSADDEYLLLFDMHHIIGDGTSLGILVGDFVRLHEGEELAPLRIQYKDFTQWQNNLFETGKIKEQQAYWLELYRDARNIPALALPGDYPRPGRLDFSGDTYEFSLGAEPTSRLKKMAADNGSTLYMSLAAVFYVLLYKYTGQEDIIVGTGVLGRPHTDLENIIGMFVNSLAVRNYPGPGKAYREFLKEVKINNLGAFENQDVQFEALVDMLNLERDASRNPLFDVLFVVQNFEWHEVKLKDLTFTPCKNGRKTSKFDLAFFAVESGNEIGFTVEYSTKLFKPSTIEQIAANYIEILTQAVENSNLKLAEFQITDDLVPVKPVENREYEKDFNF